MINIGNKAAERGEELIKYLNSRNFYLVGVMGCGKTIIGQQLARRLPGYRFVDTDQLIERYAGQTVSQIFESKGEESFRKLETEVMKVVAQEERLVVATGGGVVTKQENWEHMQTGTVYWLDGTVGMIAQRLIQDVQLRKRPLLEGAALGSTIQEKVGGIAQQLSSILDKRKDMYARADFRIPIDSDVPAFRHGATPNQVVFLILDALYQEVMKFAESKKNDGDVLEDGDVQANV